MTLPPDADKSQVRQAVIVLLDKVQELQDLQSMQGEALEEAERRIELLSNALRSTLNHGTDTPHFDTPTATQPHQSLVNQPREPRPVGDGAKYWTDERGFSVPTETIPEEIRSKWQRPLGTPRLEYEDT